MAVRALLLALVLLGCAACGADETTADGSGGQTTAATTDDREESTVTTVDGCEQVENLAPKPDGGQEPPDGPLDAAESPQLVFATTCGEFTVSLDPELAPNTGASLVKLARNGFYDGTIFHRIVPGFVIQGGDPTGSGTGGPGYKTVDKPPADARYTKGVVAMAKAGDEPAGTSGSQFFVVTGADVGLPPDYAIVGRVAQGIGVVELIGELGDQLERPTQTVVIRKVTVRG